MKTHVYTVCWNEIYYLPHFFKHYDWADKIVVYDNGSNDGSQEFVKSHPKGELRTFFTNNQKSNEANSRVKNNCWKADRGVVDWVVVCDIDEFLVGWEKLRENKQPIIYKCEGWQMVADSPPDDFSTVTLGVREDKYDKCICFSPNLRDIGYNWGAHKAEPRPFGRDKITVVSNVMKLKHFCYLGEDFVVKRFQRQGARQSAEDIRRHAAGRYREPEDKIRELYKKYRNAAVQFS